MYLINIGNIEHFDPNITSYLERMEKLFACNEVETGKRVSMFLTLIGREAYKALKDLLDPDLPKTKSYNELKDVLTLPY